MGAGGLSHHEDHASGQLNDPTAGKYARLGIDAGYGESPDPQLRIGALFFLRASALDFTVVEHRAEIIGTAKRINEALLMAFCWVVRDRCAATLR